MEVDAMSSLVKATAFRLVRCVSLCAITATAVFILILDVAANVGHAKTPEPGRVLRGKEAFGDWREDAPGVRRLITIDDLPEVTSETVSYSKVVPRPVGALPQVPSGFKVEEVVSGLAQPRAIQIAPNGDVFVSNGSAGEVRVYRLTPGSARAIESQVFVSGLHQPFGIAFYPLGPDPKWIYVAQSNGVVRFPYQSGQLTTTAKPESIIDCIPATHHWTRDILFTPDSQRLILEVGSGSNAALDMFPAPRVSGGLDGWNKIHPLGAAWDTEEGRANILSFKPDGSDRQILATGLRNPTGLTFQPQTGQLWAVVNERDGLGDNTPFEYATHVQSGAFYGWPWFYLGAHQDPRHPGEHDDLKDKITVPDVFMQAHSAPMQIAFYDGDEFPAEYQGSAFVAMHGSWDRSTRTGYKVVRLIFDKTGKATGEYEDFMTGFVVSDTDVWGRPVGVAVAKDGSLLVTDDGSGTLWRVSHR
jgi:glucose/arabinose dehydrogenase